MKDDVKQEIKRCEALYGIRAVIQFYGGGTVACDA